MPPKRARDLSPLELAILISLVGGAKHGYRIVKEVESRHGSGRPIHPANLYRRIRDLLGRGLIVEADGPGAKTGVAVGSRAKTGGAMGLGAETGVAVGLGTAGAGGGADPGADSTRERKHFALTREGTAVAKQEAERLRRLVSDAVAANLISEGAEIQLG